MQEWDMKKYFNRFTAVLLLFAALGITILSTGCSQPNQNHEGFAIYSTKEPISPSKITALSQIKIADNPAINLNDIVSYNEVTHEITLTQDAFSRITNPNKPVWGPTFVVCVDRKPIYWGAVLNMASSVIYNGVTIITPLPVSQEIAPITIGLGYPDAAYFKGTDPRNNTPAMDSLKQAGKLTSEGFAIYLTKNNIPPTQMEALSHVEIADQPIIALNDIISYNPKTYDMTLTENAIKRLSELQVPTSGKSFVVCIDKNPVYWGAFWTPISSQAFSGITIMVPFSGQKTNVIRLMQGYPGQSSSGNSDPRDNPAIIDSLRQAGKLFASDNATLPRSFKGYELYSWQQDGKWYFTVITGTNRNKTPEEIISGAENVTQDGLVLLRADGLSELKALLDRIPENDFVTWLIYPRTEQLPNGFGYPPADIVKGIKEYTAQCGLNFTVFE